MSTVLTEPFLFPRAVCVFNRHSDLFLLFFPSCLKVLEVKARYYEALQAAHAAASEGDNLIVLDEGRQSSLNLGTCCNIGLARVRLCTVLTYSIRSLRACFALFGFPTVFGHGGLRL